MDALLAEASIGITELKKNPSAVIRNAGDAPVVILHHNRPTAYLVPVRRYEAMMDMLDERVLTEEQAGWQHPASVSQGAQTAPGGTPHRQVGTRRNA